jgi:hypothetical protein
MRKLILALLFAIAAPAARAQAPSPTPNVFIHVPDPAEAYQDSLNAALHIAEDSLRRFPQPLPQVVGPDPRFFQMDDWVREYLATEWRNKTVTDPASSERGYCLTYQLDWGWNNETAYRITNITKPDSLESSDVGAIVFSCKPDQFKAEIHVHPPSTCTAQTTSGQYCWFGGTDAYECFPSDGDKAHLDYWLVDDRFAALQCDEHAVIYWTPDPKRRQAGLLAREIIKVWRAAKPSR